jgi:hypothetical protein
MACLLLLTGRDAAADNPTCGQQLRPVLSQARTGRRRVACPRRVSLTATGCLRASPSTPRHATQPSSLPSTVNNSDVPPGMLATRLSAGSVVPAGRAARRSRATVRHPATAQLLTVQPFALDGLPGTTPRRLRSVAGRDAPSARAASLVSSAALAVSARRHRGRGPQPLRWTLRGTLRRPPAYPLHRPGAPFPLVMPLGGAERPQGALRAIDSSACPRSWRTCGPRRLRRQSEPALVATDGAAL